MVACHRLAKWIATAPPLPYRPPLELHKLAMHRGTEVKGGKNKDRKVRELNRGAGIERKYGTQVAIRFASFRILKAYTHSTY